MFIVYDNHRPAKYPECNVDPSWANNQFATLAEARTYAKKWLGVYGESLQEEDLQVDIPYEYNTGNDSIIIREYPDHGFKVDDKIRLKTNHVIEGVVSYVPASTDEALCVKVPWTYHTEDLIIVRAADWELIPPKVFSEKEITTLT
jgi:hypothetical protein